MLRSICGADLNALIKAHKNDRDYKSGTNQNGSKYVSMFIPFEIDEGYKIGIKLDVQFEDDAYGGRDIYVDRTTVLGPGVGVSCSLLLLMLDFSVTYLQNDVCIVARLQVR